MRNTENLGWSFFVLGSLVFTAAGIVNGDWWAFVGGLLYVVGCVFLFRSATEGSVL